MTVFLPEAKVHVNVKIYCPWCEQRQDNAEREVFRLFGKVLLCENEYCNNHFRLPDIGANYATKTTTRGTS